MTAGTTGEAAVAPPERSPFPGTPIDVVVPVYRGLDDTRRCIESVLASACRLPFELVVIDDCSPEPALSAYLDDLAAARRITLLRNPANRGFVATVNRGMALHPDRDVVLLNSDTEVANDWLDRLAASAHSAPDVATVTPFSNNATVCSYPFEGWTGEIPGTLGLAGLDVLVARTLRGVVAELPTAIGFCMYIRRDCLAAIGAFDEEAFGRGYGEENDFSLRAAKAGWRNVFCADVFIHHRGGVSFGDERTELQRRAEQALLAKHPDYNERVQAFLAADPLRPLREAIDRARATCGADEAVAVVEERALEQGRLRHDLRQARQAQVAALPAPARIDAPAAPATVHQGGRRSRPVLLHISHSWGGGIERWLSDFARADEAGWNLVLRSRTGRNEAGIALELVDPEADGEVLAAWTLAEPIRSTAVEHAEYRDILAAILGALPVQAVLVSSLIGHSLEALDTRLPTVVVLHDLYPYCPALFGWFGGRCTTCDEGALRRCFSGNPLNVFWQHDDAEAWAALRAAYAGRLAAEHVTVAAPSRDVQARYAALFPVLRDKPWTLVPHGLGGALSWRFAAAAAEGGDAPRDADRRLRIVVPGRLLPHKGLALLHDILPAVADFADVLLLGSGDHGKPFEQLGHVRVVADYAHETLAGHVRAFAPDCALLLSVLPETFSYTLSEMWALHVPVIATRRGSFVERIEEGVNGFLVEPEVPDVLARLRALAAERGGLAAVAVHLRTAPVRDTAQMVADYRRVLGLPAMVDAAAGPMPLVGALAAQIERVRDETGEIRATIARKEQTIAEIAAWAHDLEGALLAERAARDAERAHAAALAQDLRSLQAQRDAIFASHSWRVTAPLRTVSEALRRRAQPALQDPQPEQVDAAAAPAILPPTATATAAETAAAPVPGDAGVALAGVWFKAGDPLARRRAERLASHLGVSAAALTLRGAAGHGASVGEEGAALSGEALRCLTTLPPSGVSVVLQPPIPNAAEARPSDLPLICFEASAAGVLASEACRILVPAGTELVPEGGQGAREFRTVTFPLVGDWPRKVEREAVRRRQREILVVPDRTRIVLGSGRGDADSGLLAFARAARSMAGRRNDVCFVWLGGHDPDWLERHWLEIGGVTTLRRLFLVEDAEFEPWLEAGDAYLSCRAEGVYDAGAVEALAAGLPVIVPSAAALPLALLDRRVAEAVGVASGEPALDRLEQLFSATDVHERHAALAGSVVACLGTPACFDAFVAACLRAEAGLQPAATCVAVVAPGVDDLPAGWAGQTESSHAGR